MKIGSIREELLYLLCVLIPKSNRLNKLVIGFYSIILIPVIEKKLKRKHKNLVSIKIRNSLKHEKDFHFLFSDIDTSLIVKINSHTNELIRDFLKIKSFFIMLDFPEIYTEVEYVTLQLMALEKTWNVVRVFWSIRKLNWNKLKKSKKISRYSDLKLERSVKVLMNRILLEDAEPINNQYKISDIKYLNELIPFSEYVNEVSIFSEFLGGNNPYGLSIVMSNFQFGLFNYLIPGDPSLDNKNLELQNVQYFLDCKNAILEYEKLILISSLRLKSAKKENISELDMFIKYLESYGKKKTR